MYEQSLTFSFEAAHRLSSGAGEELSPEYLRIHGHSFVVTFVLRGNSLQNGKWLCDFADLRKVSEAIKEQLDHRLLNEVEDLSVPTLENIAAWIFSRAATSLAPLFAVTVERPTLGERVTYSADA